METRRADDSRFMVSITRMYKCQLPGEAKPMKFLRIPAELYPQESVRRHEEGVVVMELLFDDDWCVHKVSIVESSGFFRLDAISLKYAMYLKLKFDVKERIDGQPVMRLPIAWGAGQQEKSRAMMKKYGIENSLEH